jgi:tetratricopeptide (TPR) repeat protein
MKRIALVFFIFAILGTDVFSQNPDQLIKEANESYARSEYSYAIELYEQVLEQGFEASELHYNLGNAYFKNNRLGNAVLHYERALRLDPANENILHNLQITKNRLVDRTDERPKLFYERWWQNIYMMQSATGWGITSIILLFLLLSLTALYLFSRTRGVKKTSFYAAIFLMLLTVFSFIFAQKQYNRLTADNEAVIMNPRVSAKSSPSPQSPDLFLVHEGTKVYVRSIIGEWYEIGLPDGNVGWVKKETLEVI